METIFLLFGLVAFVLVVCIVDLLQFKKRTLKRLDFLENKSNLLYSRTNSLENQVLLTKSRLKSPTTKKTTKKKKVNKKR